MVSPEYTAMSLEKRPAAVQTQFRRILKSGELTGIPFKTVVKEGNLWPTIEESINVFEKDGAVRFPIQHTERTRSAGQCGGRHF